MYTLFRNYDPALTRAQLDGMALASLATLDTFIYRGGTAMQTADHGIRWVRSYWEQGGTWGLCLYEAPNREILAIYQDLCGLPFRAMEEVVELPGTASTKNGSRVAVEFRLDPDADAPRHAALLGGASATLDRLYWNAPGGRAVAVFCVPDESAAKSLLAREASGPSAAVVEISPDEYR
jgi:hypothetical protein